MAALGDLTGHACYDTFFFQCVVEKMRFPVLLSVFIAAAYAAGPATIVVEVASPSAFRLGVRFDGWSTGALMNPSLSLAANLPPAPSSPVSWGGMSGLQTSFGALLTDGSTRWALYDSANNTLVSGGAPIQNNATPTLDGGIVLPVNGTAATSGPARQCLGNGFFGPTFYYNREASYLAFVSSSWEYDPTPSNHHCYPSSFSGSIGSSDACNPANQQTDMDVTGPQRSAAYPNGLSGQSLASCCAACNGASDCVAFVYSTGADPDPNGNCWPLAGYSGTRENAGRILGTAGAPPPDSGKGWWAMGGAADWYLAPTPTPLDWTRCFYELTGAPAIPPRYGVGWVHSGCMDFAEGVTLFGGCWHPRARTPLGPLCYYRSLAPPLALTVLLRRIGATLAVRECSLHRVFHTIPRFWCSQHTPPFAHRAPSTVEEVEGYMVQFRDGAFPIDSFIMDYDWYVFTAHIICASARSSPLPRARRAFCADCIPLRLRPCPGRWNTPQNKNLDFGYDPTMFGNHSFIHPPGSSIPNATTSGPVELFRHFHRDINMRFGGIRKPRTYSNFNLSNTSGWLLPNSFDVGAGDSNWNMSAPGWADWYTTNHLHFLSDGLDFWWNDEGEYSTTSAHTRPLPPSWRTGASSSRQLLLLTVLPHWHPPPPHPFPLPPPLSFRSPHCDAGETQWFTYFWWNLAQQAMQRQALPNTRHFTINRAFQAGMQTFPAVTWTGDRQDCSHATVLTFTTAGQLYTACDMTAPDATVLVRQYQNAIFLPIMRTHAMHGTPRFPFLWGADAEPAFRKALQTRYTFLPHIYSLMHLARATGQPLALPASYIFYNDATFPPALGDATYMFSDVLLPADVSTANGNDPNENTTHCNVPPGVWFVYNSTVTVIGPIVNLTYTDVPLDALVLFVRAGAILALNRDIVQFSDAIGGDLEVQVYAGRDGAFTLVEDDGVSLDYATSPSTATRSTQFVWVDATRTLSWTVSGGFTGGPNIFTRAFPVLFVSNASAPVTAASQALGVAGSVTF